MSNPLVNVLTPQIRAWLYALLFLASLGFGAWQAAGGDWYEFAAGLVTALLSATAASNASWTDTHDDYDPDDIGEADAIAPTPEEIDDLPTEHFHGGTEENPVRAPGKHRAEPQF